jgi:hypothetical protein
LDLAQETDLRWLMSMSWPLDVAKLKLLAYIGETAADRDDQCLCHNNDESEYGRRDLSKLLCAQRQDQHRHGSDAV